MRLAVNGWFLGRETTGSGQYLHHLLDHLPRQRADIDIGVFTPSRSYNPRWHDRWPQVHLVPTNPPRFPRNLQKVWWEQITFPRVARAWSPDVLWVPYWAAPLWQPCPVVVTVHDVIPLILPAYSRGLHQRAYTRLVAYTARRAAAVLTVSHASARDIANRLNIPPERVHTVYHGPNFERGENGTDAEGLEAVRNKYSLPDKYFLYLGGFDARKNVLNVIRAYSRYLQTGGDNSIYLVIAGALPAEDSAFAPDPRRITADLHLEGQVHFCGWVDEADKPAIYARALAFIFPSLYEGFGMMVLEAMAAGTPVITSDR